MSLDPFLVRYRLDRLRKLAGDLLKQFLVDDDDAAHRNTTLMVWPSFS
jgi:hypothetical protein